MRRRELLLRWFFIALLTVASGGKLLDMAGFYDIVNAYRMLPEASVPVTAWLMTLWELALAIWLVSGWEPRAAALAVMAVHLLYLAWLLMALGRGLEIANCGCFGVYFARPLTWIAMVEDLVLLGLSYLLWRFSSSTSEDTIGQRRRFMVPGKDATHTKPGEPRSEQAQKGAEL